MYECWTNQVPIRESNSYAWTKNVTRLTTMLRAEVEEAH